MKFITEDDLRDLYKKEPFTQYEIKPGTRITPGARQFLADRGIHMFDNLSSWANNIKPGVKKAKGPVKAASLERRKQLSLMRLESKLDSVAVLLLEGIDTLLERDAELAQKIIYLYRHISGFKSLLHGKGSVSDLCCEKCTGFNQDNFSDYIDDCFEITEVHIQLDKGKNILLLHKLRCALRAFELDILDTYDCHDGESKSCEEMLVKVNQIINTISQYICHETGGEICQRK